jgi:tetratricopeptide (TPR) repeat protein
VPEAVAHYNAALRLNPNYAKAHNNLGLALIQMDRPAEARHHFEEALRLYPGYEDARRNLEETATKKMNIEHRTPNIERQTGEAEETDR